MNPRFRTFRALGLIAAIATTAFAQSPSTGRADAGILVVDPATGLSIPVGSTVTPLFTASPTVPDPADLGVAANGDLLLTNTSGQFCGSGALTTHVFRVPMAGAVPVLPVNINTFTNTPVDGHLIDLLPNGDLLIGGTCSLTQFLYRVDSAGNVTNFNPASPINDPDGYTVGALNGVPTLFVSAQDELVTFDISNLSNPIPTTRTVDLSTVGLTSLGNWGRVMYDPNTQTLLSTYVGHPTVERTIEIDLNAQSTSLLAHLEGPDSLEPLVVLEDGTRLWGSTTTNAIGFVDKSGPNFTFVPLMSGFVGSVRAVAAPDGSFFILDKGNTNVYRWDPTLRCDTLDFDTTQSGLVNLKLKNPNRPNELFLVLCSPIGATPGTPFGSTTIPLNYDIVTELLALGVVVGNPYQLNWFGTLDAFGEATAQLNLPANLNIPAGYTLHFSYIMNAPIFASNAVHFHTR